MTASGSAVNTGASETGANSLGSEDFSAALALLDEGYVSSAKCAWFMNKKTLANISGIVTKYGRLLNLVQYENGKPSVFGIPVKICPSMDNIRVRDVPYLLSSADRNLLGNQIGDGRELWYSRVLGSDWASRIRQRRHVVLHTS